MTDTTTSIDRLLDATRVDDVTFSFDVPDGWRQGRGAFGGLVVGAMVRAATALNDDDSRRVRSVTAELLGPVLPGRATLAVEKLRQGSGVSAVRVRLLQDSGTGVVEEQACAVVVLAKSRPGTPSFQQRAVPHIPDVNSVDVVAVEPPLGPVFAGNFIFRPTGAFPFSGATQATAAGFIQPKLPIAAVDAAVVAACADAWWPTLYATLDAPRPMATITFALELLIDPRELDPTLPLFHEAKSETAVDGYSVEHRALWTTDGRLVAENQQLFAIIR
ncbi:MAG TPA: thioesterase family protein [Myxococcota bacterium]